MNNYFKVLNEKLENRFTVPKEESIISSNLSFVEVDLEDIHLKTISDASNKEWGLDSGHFFKEGSNEILYKAINENGDLIGFFSIVIASDTTEENNMVPWLAKLFIMPEFRSMGFGSTLQSKAEDIARDMGHDEMFTFSDLKGYYEKGGWEKQADVVKNGQGISLFTKNLREDINSKIKPLYHVSKNDLSGETLTPKVPDNYMTRNNYENNTIKRVSFSTSIEGSLLGLSQDLKDQEFYVFEPVNYEGLNIVTTKELLDKGYVPDAHLSKEVWVTNDVTLKNVGKIKVIEPLEEPVFYKYGNNKNAQIYNWRYEWVKTLKEDNEVELEPFDVNMEGLQKRFLDVFARALHSASKVVGNVVYQIEEEFYSRADNFIRKGIYAIYEYIPGDNNLFPIIEYKVKGGKEEETYQIGKQPLSYFTDGTVATYRSFGEIISNMNARGENWFWNGFSSEEQEEEFRELLAIIEPKTSLKEEESQDDEIMLEPITSADVTEGSTKMVGDGKWEVWKPNSEAAMINLSQGTKWLSGSSWMARERQYDEISEESWDLKNWDKALVIINKNKLENKFLFQRGWGGMYSPSFARYSMATWVIKQNSPALLKWFAEQNFQYVSKRLKAKLGVDRVAESGGVYNYPEGGELPWGERGSVTKVIIAPGTTKIKSRAFSNFRNVKEIELPDAITSIGEYAFGGMDSLESIKLPSKLRKIADNAFYQCLSLKQVVIPNGVTEIGRSAFGSCQKLETLFIPNSVTKVDQIVSSWQRQQPELLTIYCEAKERPAGWDEDFNSLVYNRTWDGDTGKTNEERTYAPVVWGASKPNVSESVENGELEAIDIQENVLYEDERWKAFRPLNLATLIDFSSDTDLIDNIRFKDIIGSKPFDANSPLLNNFDEFKKEAYFFHDKQANIKYMYLPEEMGWNLIYKGMQKNIMSKWWNMKEFIRFLSITPGFKQFIITKFPHVKPQQFFEEVEGDVDLIVDPEVVFTLTSQPNYTRPTADEREVITKAIIDKSVTTIQSNTFFGCINLKEVVFHDEITHIDDLAFAECEKLEFTKLPPKLIRIGGEAFRNCKSIKEITIPATVKHIGNGAFKGTDSLKKFHMENNTSSVLIQPFYAWHWADGLYWHKLDTNFATSNLREDINNTPLEEEDASDLLSTDTPDLEVINDKKVLYKDEEWEVVRPITFGALIDLGSGTSWFGNSSRYPGDEEEFHQRKGEVYYFIINKKNPQVKYLMSPRNIGKGRIKSYENNNTSSVQSFLNKVKTTRGLQNWFKKTFKGLTWQIEKHQEKEDELISINYIYTYPGTEMKSWGYEVLVEEVIIKQGTEFIKENAFQDFSKIKEIKIPSSVKTIGHSAFRGCKSLESIEIPEGVTKIERDTFWGCSNLKDVKLPKSLLSIGDEAFWGCNSLETIELPQGLTTIEDAAFLGCHNLSNVFVPISVTYMGSQALEIRNSVYNKQEGAVIMCEAPSKPSGWDDKWTHVGHVNIKWGVSK